VNGEAKMFKLSRVSLAEWLTIFALLAVLLAVIAMQLSEPDRSHRRGYDKRRMCKIDMNQVLLATKLYEDVFREPPNGNTDAFFAALCGQNSRKRKFLEIDRLSQDSKGSFFDPWRTSYAIVTNSTNGLSIRSAGPNRRFGDADDLEQPL